MITFVDPRAEPAAAVEPYTLAIDLRNGSPAIGLVANGFPDSERFLDHVEQALGAALPAATFRRWNKGNASATISADMLDEVVESCDAVIGAYGH